MKTRRRGAGWAIVAGLRGWATGGAAGLGRALNEDHIRLAVTGLSRAGKTAFITSLIHNLLALGKGRDTLPKISARLTRNGATRLRGVEVLPAGAGTLPFFDYASKLGQLASASPSWPPRTEDLAQISLMLEMERPSALGRRLGPRRIRLDILDYPGEWLLDLPMLGQSYAQWSEQTLALLRTSPRRESSAAFLADLRPEDRAEEPLLHKGHMLFRAALLACRNDHDLRYLQPGRFVCPGPGNDAPFMWFFPMQLTTKRVRPKTNAALLEARFLAYRNHVRASFFDDHFASFDRQIMLVDVLGGLYAGKAAFEDTARVIQDLAAALRYGGNTLPRTILARILAGLGYLLPWVLARGTRATAQKLSNRRIEKLVFVATKADHVPALRRDNLLHLLRALADTGSPRQGGRAAEVSHRVAASILCTQDGTAMSGDTVVEVVQGVVLGEDKVRPFFVGDVPANLPHESFWSERFLRIPVFRPPPIDPNGTTGIAHLNLDAVLDDVIGDLL